MNKTFVITMFGSSLPWIKEYIENAQRHEGWYWKIFTPNKIESKGNVEIVPMTIEQFNDLVEKKLGVRPTLSIIDKGIPSSHITDFYIYSGVIFEDYLKGADYWGITNLDVVYGRLGRYFGDDMLSQCDVFSDDVGTVNGVFSLWKNVEKVNRLYLKIDKWRDILAIPPCKGCTSQGDHKLWGADEYLMTEVLRHNSEIKFLTPKYYPYLSHDRLEQHIPKPKLELKEDGSLWELFSDTNPVDGELSRPIMGKEIPYFHFSRTKEWPL